MVVVESTRPLTPEEDYEQWESLLVSKGYEFVYFDGLNRFYVWAEKSELANSFRAGPNIFDGFSLSSHSAFCAEVNVQYGKLEKLLETERAALESGRQQIVVLQESIAHSEAAARDELAGATRQCMQAQATAIQAQEEKILLQQDKITLQKESSSLRDTNALLREAVAAAEQQTARAFVDVETQRTALLADLALAEQKIQDLTTSAAQQQLEVENNLRIQLALFKAETTSELDAAYARIDEVSHVAHRWWVTAEQQRTELEAMKSSRSWALTRPLRNARYAVARVLAVVRFRTKVSMRPLVAASVATAMKFPVLKRMALPLLARSPRALERIRRIAVDNGLIPAPHVFVPIAPHARPPRQLQVQGRAAKVLQDLKQAMDTQGADK